jgi:hypothetical protein
VCPNAPRPIQPGHEDDTANEGEGLIHGAGALKLKLKKRHDSPETSCLATLCNCSADQVVFNCGTARCVMCDVPLAPEESLRDESGSLRSSVHTMSVIGHRCCAGLYPCLPPSNNGQDERDVFKVGLSMSQRRSIQSSRLKLEDRARGSLESQAALEPGEAHSRRGCCRRTCTC